MHGIAAHKLNVEPNLLFRNHGTRQHTYPRGWWELRERSDVFGGHVTRQLEPIPADLLHADLLPFSYVKCGLHTGAGHYWCSWFGKTFSRATASKSDIFARSFHVFAIYSFLDFPRT